MDMTVDTRSSLLTVRPLAIEDAEAVSSLSTQLGYPCDAATMRKRIHQLTQSSDRIAFVAVLEDVVVGWADASIERHLQSQDVVELGGLVVKEGHRGLGIGRRLCEAVEQWAVRQEIPRVRVRSQIKRQDAHRFYLRDGYEHVKTSEVFEKRLG